MERYDLFIIDGVLMSYVDKWDAHNRIFETLTYQAVIVDLPNDYKPLLTNRYWIIPFYDSNKMELYKRRYGVRPKPKTLAKIIKEFEDKQSKH
jgi:hypothetical protein